ncbi:MAG: 2-oxoacid:acceptor oxidoreductase family protein [Tepidanaerobacteraceae bacterium]|jgi:pyruvate ferredoxin oxidoreductase gamma subunit|nr:2-oxoacid:acceptor oxidoreductase family protein [Tepidanaerobacteraceae bacterium]
MLEIRIHGRGGQGVVTLAELVAKTALKSGWEVQTMPFFGVERRGAAVKAAVRLDSRPIRARSLSYRPDMLVLMHENLLDTGIKDGISDDAEIVANASRPLPFNKIQWLVDASAIAIKNNLVSSGEPFINVAMSGAVCRALEIPFSHLEKTISEQWDGKKALANIEAAREAYEAVRRIEGGLCK